MKLRTLIYSLVVSAITASPVLATTIWQEEFAYANGVLTNVSYPTWTSFSGTGNFIPVTEGEVLVAGYSTSSDDSRRALGASYTSGALYMSALVKVTTAPTSASGDYFLSFYNSPSSGGGYAGRIFASTTATGWTFGLANASSTPTDWSTDLSLNTYYKIVTKFDLSTKTASMGVFAPGYQPLADSELTLTGGTAGSVLGIDNIALRQAGTAQGAALIDSIWVGTELGDVAPLAVPEPSAMAIFGGFGMLALVMAARRRK